MMDNILSHHTGLTCEVLSRSSCATDLLARRKRDKSFNYIRPRLGLVGHGLYPRK